MYGLQMRKKKRGAEKAWRTTNKIFVGIFSEASLETVLKSLNRLDLIRRRE